jgi:hypothetical protein
MEGKRPEKKITVAFILSQFSCLMSNVPGVNQDSITAQLRHGNYFLYRNEVDKIKEENAGQAGFDADAFEAMLQAANAVKEQAAPSLTEGMVLLDSLERAKEVANNPENDAEVKAISDIMSAMKKLRDKVNPLINAKASCSIALKNKKSAKAAAAADADAPDAAPVSS